MRLYLIKLAEEDGVADNFTEEDEFPEENAAVLEKLEKNGAFAALAGEGGVADNSVEETEERAGEACENATVLEKLEKNGAEKLE